MEIAFVKADAVRLGNCTPSDQLIFLVDEWPPVFYEIEMPDFVEFQYNGIRVVVSDGPAFYEGGFIWGVRYATPDEP